MEEIGETICWVREIEILYVPFSREVSDLYFLKISLLQQLSQDVEPDEIRPIRQQSHSPLNSSPPGLHQTFASSCIVSCAQ